MYNLDLFKLNMKKKKKNLVKDILVISIDAYKFEM